jgi:hypothetical protein
MVHNNGNIRESHVFANLAIKFFHFDLKLSL